MLFKEKMYLGSFIRLICLKTIQIPENTYEDYLLSDKEKVLTSEEFKLYNDKILIFRLLLLMAGIMQKGLENKIKLSSEDVGKTFAKAVSLAFEDNGFSVEQIEKNMDTLFSYFDGLLAYMGDFDESEILKKGLYFYACMYFSKKFNSLNADKYCTIITLINNNRKLMSNYFEDSFSEIKLIY